MQGQDAPRKLNTLIWSIMAGIVFYGLIRLILRKRIGAAIQPKLRKINPGLLDEITYRAVAIGFPLFTLGGLRSEEHTSELQSRGHLVCRLLLEKKQHYTAHS